MALAGVSPVYPIVERGGCRSVASRRIRGGLDDESSAYFGFAHVIDHIRASIAFAERDSDWSDVERGRCGVGRVNADSVRLARDYMANHGVLDDRSPECEGCGAILFAVATGKPVLRLGADWSECVAVYVFGWAQSVQTDCHLVGCVVLWSGGFAGDIAAAVYEQTAGRTAGELATYRRSAPAVVVGIPAADLRPASFWAT